MSKNIVLDKKQQFFAISLSVVLSLLVVWAAASGATTISTNISTGGTLAVTGASTLTGVATMDGGALLTASSTAVGKFQVNGALNASSSIYVLGAARFDSGVGLGSANSVAKTLLWSPLTSDPTASEGLVYYNSSSKVLKMSDGTAWWTVGTSTSGLTLSGSRLQLADLGYYLTVGTTTQRGLSMMTLEATSTAAIPLTIVAKTSQSADLFRVLNQQTNELFALDALGNASGTSMSLSAGLIVTASSTFNSTLNVSSLSTLTDGFISVASSTAVGNFKVIGSLNASTTAFIGGTLNVPGGITGFVSTGSSTVSNNLTVSGELHASSTLAVTGAATFNNSLTTATSSATTTLAINADSNGATGGEGGCLQLTAQNGKLYRMYITAADATVFATTTGRGSGTQVSAVWEVGACQ